MMNRSSFAQLDFDQEYLNLSHDFLSSVQLNQAGRGTFSTSKGTNYIYSRPDFLFAFL
jgi:hypothetical protein